MENVEKRSDVGRFRNFQNEASCAVDHSLNFIKENLRRASKEIITVIKPGENNHTKPALKDNISTFLHFKTYLTFLTGSSLNCFMVVWGLVLWIDLRRFGLFMCL